MRNKIPANAQRETEQTDDVLLVAGKDVADLTNLTTPNEQDVAVTLRARMLDKNTYTAIGSSVLVSLNPFHHADEDIQNEAVQKYIREYKYPLETKERLEPHIFQLTADVYLRMRRLAENQVIMFSGGSASGKSTNRDACITFLAALSNYRKVKKMPTLVMDSHIILEAFGTTMAPLNSSASQYGSFLDLHFNGRGHMVGGHLKPFNLNKGMVTNCSKSEHNYNVFSYLLSGASALEKTQCYIQNSSSYSYLGNGKRLHSTKSRDEDKWKSLRSAFASLGFKDHTILRIMQILSAILLIGNLIVVDESMVGGSKSGVAVRNIHVLENIADLLGVEAIEIENLLRYKTKMIQNNMTSKLLSWKEATQQRHSLAATLYLLLFEYIVYHINKKMSGSQYENTIGLLDLPYLLVSGEEDFYQLSRNYVHEKALEFRQRRIFALYKTELEEEGIQLPHMQYNDNAGCLYVYTSEEGVFSGLNHLVTEHKNGTSLVEMRLKKQQNARQHLSFPRSKIFCIRHYAGQVNYSIEILYHANHETDPRHEFAEVFCKGPTGKGSSNPLVVKLFSSVATETKQEPVKDSDNQPPADLQAVNHEEKSEEDENQITISSVVTACDRLQQAVDDLFASFHNSAAWFVICIRSSNWGLKDTCDIKILTEQLRDLGVCDIVKKASFRHTVMFTADECRRHFSQAFSLAKTTPELSFVEMCEALEDDRDWNESDILFGSNRVFLSEKAWRTLEDEIRLDEKSENRRHRQEPSGKQHGDYLVPLRTQYDRRSTFDIASYTSDMEISEGEISGSEAEDQSQMTSEVTKAAPKKRTRTKTSPSRKVWLVITWLITWWIPGVLLGWIGRMKRSDIRMAWREKFALCFLILLLSAAMVWFIAFFGHLVCPVKHLYSQYELQSKISRIDGIVSIRGEVFDLAQFAPRHWASDVIPNMALIQYAGKDVSHLFPIQVSALCDGASEPVSNAVTLDNYVDLSDPNANYHDFRYFTSDFRPDWYYEKMTYLRKNYRLGYMGYDPSDVRFQANNPVQLGGITSTRKWAILDGSIYDLTFYFMGGRSIRMPNNKTAPSNIDMDFIDNSIAQLFKSLAGTDITELFNQLPLDPDLRERQLICLRNIFLVGKLDSRNSPQCVLSEYLLLIISGFLCSVILFKFIAALQVTSMPGDMEFDKFIVCQVPCYTEGEESIRKTINSITTLKYDDNRKLLFIITDGMIVGSGNEQSTPRIVLDILGANDTIEREALPYISIGEGHKRQNRAKVYSGLYEHAGHVVPYIVVVKVGNISEHQKPGNRGKRDSQMVLMQFLNKVHYNSEMSPMEYEIYHHIQNIIGVNPFYYEFVLMVDADTEVLQHSLNSLVSSFVDDDKIIGMCGETMLSNEKDTWITMIQVYEYYISHFLSKAFESLFGTVTCLPGCFCMYRVRSVGINQALLVSNSVITDYGDNKVDTLHKKNLLHLGEDRYLTTLILKHFPTYKTKFNPHAACLTSAPDSWSVLVSQRRRWINSTIHNLGELIFLPQMCGFCCFSMRFVVILDLLSTLVMPAVVCYLGYLIYQLTTHTSQVPLMSLITLASVYGLQAFIFIIRRKWEHIAWLIIYIIAIPAFSFFIPIYAFWHFDDFTWGNTRMVVDTVGEQKAAEPADEEFDPSAIPKRRWQAYEDEIFDDKKANDNPVNHFPHLRPPTPIVSPKWFSPYTSPDTDIGTFTGVRELYDSKESMSWETMQDTFPNDEAIVSALYNLLETADLKIVTKKQVRQELSNVFGIDMAPKRDFINGWIEHILEQDNFMQHYNHRYTK